MMIYNLRALGLGYARSRDFTLIGQWEISVRDIKSTGAVFSLCFASCAMVRQNTKACNTRPPLFYTRVLEVLRTCALLCCLPQYARKPGTVLVTLMR